MRLDRRIKIQTSLRGLGATPDHVRASLAAAGVRGLLREPSACPVTRYLEHVLGDGSRIRVNGYEAVVLDERGATLFVVSLPNPVREAVLLFDTGRWPELEEASLVVDGPAAGPSLDARRNWGRG